MATGTARTIRRRPSLSEDYTYNWLDSQWEFLKSEAKELCLSGAYRSGKTRPLCGKIVKHALIPGNLVGLCRKTFASLRITTLRTLLLPDGDLPPVLPEGSYEHNKSEHLIKLHGGGEIYYFGFDNPLAIGSLGCGAIGVDEGIELDEDEYTMLIGRLSLSVDPCRQIFTATNPGPKSHFLYKRLFEQKHPSRIVIESNLLDNTFLPADYVEHMKSALTGQRYERYVLGKWGAFEGLVYDAFDAKRGVKELDHRWKRVIAGVDLGYTNPCAIVVLGEWGEDRWHMITELYQTGLVPDEVVRRAQWLGGKHKIERFYPDPSSPEMIAAFQKAGLPTTEANNAVFEGIQAVQNLLRPAGITGEPRLTIAPECVNTIREFESYAWKPEKDAPIKEMDHAMDALRYAVMTSISKPSPSVRVWATSEDEDDDN